MGTWGHGNLDSDYALDELGARSGALVKEMLLRAQRSDSRQWDEYDYTTLFVEFEIVFALDAAKLLKVGRSTLPAPDAVRKLAHDYITEWDRFDADDGPGPQRRKVILDTFERFAHLCQAHGGEAGLPQPPKPPAPVAKKAAAKAKPKKKVAAKPKKRR
jgi:hypothetical protein